MDGKIHVFFTDSKPHWDKRPWFDMKLSDISELANCDAGFVVFVLGDRNNFLVVPAKLLKAELKTYQPGPRARAEGRYHFNLHGRTFEQLPNWDLKPFAENWGLIPEHRSDSSEYQEELDRRMSEMDSGKKASEQDFEHRHEDLVKKGR